MGSPGFEGQKCTTISSPSNRPCVRVIRLHRDSDILKGYHSVARSSYIYILLDKPTRHIIGAFTVKHEMQTFVNNWDGEVILRRVRDAHPEDAFVEQSISKTI